MLIYAIAGVLAAITARQLSLSGAEDPITAFFAHDWASVGGWSLFVTLAMFIVMGAFREWWAPGARVKRLEALVASQQELIRQQSTQITKLTEGNEFTKYVMEQVIPRPSNRGQQTKVAPESDEGSTS